MKQNKHSRWSQIKRWARYRYLRVMRMNATPHSIAMGMAIGVFVGFLPIVPLQSSLTVVLCLPLRGNLVVGFMGTWISNPFNWVPFYYFLYFVGKAMVPWDVPEVEIEQFKLMLQTLDVRQFTSFGKDLLECFKVMLIAGVAMGGPVSIPTYILTRKLVVRYRKRRALRLLKKRTRLP
ncbi:MAG: DUF2062 domain-containing protein [Proteobacteria bacterium]|nr:DUF2062 domain-containing protein [Pseudomonadota bacterium]